MINYKNTIQNNCSPLIEEGLINLLPADCLNHIFQNCSNPEVESFTEVNSLWKKVIVGEKHKEFVTLLNFSKFLSIELKGDKVVCKKFIEINEFYNMLKNPTSLKQVKICFGKLKNEILNILKTLEEKDLDFLKDLSDKQSQPYFSNFLYIAKIEKEIYQALALPYYQKDAEIVKISEKLIKTGHISKAIEVAGLLTNHSSNTTNKDYVFKLIFNSCLDNGNFSEAEKFVKKMGMLELGTLKENLKKSIDNLEIDKAIAIANMMSDNLKDSYLLEIFDIVIKKKDLGKATKIISMLSDYRQNQCILKVFKLLIENGKINEAGQAIKMCVSDSDTDYVTQAACDQFIKSDAINFGFEAIKFLKTDLIKLFKLNDILDLYIENKNLDKALDVLKTICSIAPYSDQALIKIGQLDTNLEDYVAKELNKNSNSIKLLFNVLIRTGKIAKAVEALKIMPSCLVDLSIKENIFNHLLETENLKMVLDFFNSIDIFEKVKFIEPIFKFLIKTKNMDKAQEIFNKIHDSNQPNAFNLISKLLIDNDNIDNLVEIYKLMSEHQKTRVNIFELLVKNNNLNKALEMVKTLPKYRQEDALMKIIIALSELHQKNINLVEFLIENNNVEQALKIVDILPEHSQVDALVSLITYFLGKDDLEKVKELEKILLSKPQSAKPTRSCSIQ